jgi:hypothetical protein
MEVQVTINGITGQTPFDIYVCEANGSGCFYISTITSVPYIFDIPSPYNVSPNYMVKAIDANNCIISGTRVVGELATPTPTLTPTPTPTPTKINDECLDCGMEGYSYNKTN